MLLFLFHAVRFIYPIKHKSKPQLSERRSARGYYCTCSRTTAVTGPRTFTRPSSSSSRPILSRDRWSEGRSTSVSCTTRCKRYGNAYRHTWYQYVVLVIRVFAFRTNIVCAFSSSCVQTVYRMMLTDQKESLHEVCAQWHEKRNKGNASYQSVIMHHWMRSGNTAKKVKCDLRLFFFSPGGMDKKAFRSWHVENYVGTAVREAAFIDLAHSCMHNSTRTPPSLRAHSCRSFDLAGPNHVVFIWARRLDHVWYKN